VITLKKVGCPQKTPSAVAETIATAAPHVIGAERNNIYGRSVNARISTSFIERQNLTMRMNMRRFTRLTNAFSKKLENLKAAVSLHFAHYNFVRIHNSLKITPAMAAGITNRLWTIEDLLN